jgi:hypothetical protein
VAGTVRQAYPWPVPALDREPLAPLRERRGVISSLPRPVPPADSDAAAMYGKGVGRATHRPKPGSEGARKPFHDGSRQLSYRELLDLPREPAALHARLRAAAVACKCGQSVRHQTFMTAVGLLYATPIPGDLRAALLRAAALIPGIERIERIRDVAGRVGTGVTVESDVQRRVLVFDRETYELLGEGELPARGGGGAPRLLSGSAIMASGIVDSTNARP